MKRIYDWDYSKKGIYYGVWFNKRNNKYHAAITFKRKHIHLGLFDTAIEAAMAYDAASFRYHGNRARLNFPPTEPISEIPNTRMIWARGEWAIVDDFNYEWLNKYKWFLFRCGKKCYAMRSGIIDGKQMNILMHREILGVLSESVLVDHKKYTGMHNFIGNIRVCNFAQNMYNRLPTEGCVSEYKGVTWHKKRRKWIAKICFNGRYIYIGQSDSEIECAKMYDRKAHELFGEFAWLNFPEEFNRAY